MLTLKASNVADVLAALEDCTRFGARFVSAAEQDQFYSYKEIMRRARASAATLQAAGLEKGDRVAIILPTSVEFLDAFLGVQLAGGIPAALYPPFRLGKLDEYFARLRRMLSKIGARFLITQTRIKRLLGPAVVGVSSLQYVIDAGDLQSNGRWNPVTVDPDQPAFLQFSSGTTVEPKAVVMSHSTLLYNLAMMERALVYRDESEVEGGCVCWLPLYHDMGLVGCVYMGLYYPATVTYLGPDTFLARPSIWLRTLSRFRAAISPAPNFAYGYCVKKIRDDEMQGVDLSHWRAALNGAEPIDLDSVDRFSERFSRWGFKREAMTPVYGLAEAGLGVSFTDLDHPPLVTEFDREALSTTGRAKPGPGRRLIAVGRPLPGVEVEIRDPDDRLVPQGQVGRIMIQGPSIMKEYYQDPELTARTIRNGWLDTGDLGFFFDDQLYIAGRAKDLIIIRGRNYAPQEIEELLIDIEGTRAGCAIAVSTAVETEGEQLIVLAERDSRSQRNADEIAADIKARILSGLSLIPHHVEILPPGTLPRTSSGKLRRSEALRQFVAGELVPPEKVTALKLLLELGKSQLAWANFNSQER
ncbi:MAG: AMP-binding protein [Bryobacterales bacterium]|nr:AMP-binding protein [Bryobacterales bacterium]